MSHQASVKNGEGQDQLKKTLHLGGATALAIGVVVGAGMLALPGLVKQIAGEFAPLVWLLNAIVVLPLLVIFGWLGRNYPSAGGISGFVGAAFPKLRASCGILILGTFSLGIPAIALTGAAYLYEGLSAILGSQDGKAGNHLFLLSVLAALFLGLGLFSTWQGAKLAENIQKIVVILLLVILGLVAVDGFYGLLIGEISQTTGQAVRLFPANPLASMDVIWLGMGLAFFAFTGWEMLAFTSGEFHNPRRDFPLAIAFSFVIVVILYIGIALAVAKIPNDQLLNEVALIGVFSNWLGSFTASIFVAILVSLIILVNLNAAVWAGSRLVFSLAQHGLFPQKLSLDKLKGDQATPRAAVLFLASIFIIVLIAHAYGLISLNQLLNIAGQNFFILYLFSIFAFIKLAKNILAKVAGIIIIIPCILFMGGWGWGLLYALALILIPLLIKSKQE